MPYVLVGNCVHKQKEDGSAGEMVPGGCHDTPEEAKRHMRALYANVKDSVIQELSLFIVKASFETNADDPSKRMRFRMSSSDTGRDLSNEAMSVELFKSFVDRIHNNTPIPEAFKSVVCEDDWCGGMPYLSVAHYKAGPKHKNVPGVIEEVFMDGDVLKSKGYLHNSSLGRAVFDSLLDDQVKRRSGIKDFDPVRVSIGFLDLKHKHAPKHGQEYVFVRESLGSICPLCEQGIGDKIYLDGVLVHEAMTRVPMNPRTLMVAEEAMTEKSAADEIQTKRDDARSILGDLADVLVEDSAVQEKSLALVTKADEGIAVGESNVPDPSPFEECFDPNTGGYNQDCLDAKVAGQMVGVREKMPAVKSQALLDGVSASLKKIYKSYGLPTPLEAIMENKMQLGGTSVPEVPFEYDGVQSPPPELRKAPAKAETAEEVEEGENDKKKDEVGMKSKLDLAYEALKSTLAGGTKDEVQAAFNAIGVAVEETYVPAPEAVNAELVDTVKQLSAIVQNLKVELATLKAGVVAQPAVKGVPPSRALKLTPELPNQTQQPVRQMSQIQRLAYRSTGAIKD